MSQKKLLIVDDEQVTRNVYRAILENAGFQVVEAENYDDVITCMDSTIDIALLDVVLKGKSGLDVLKYIRHHFPLCPAIMISAHANKVNAIAALHDGAVDYLEKPTNPLELVHTVKHWVSFHSMQQENVRLQDYKATAEALREREAHFSGVLEIIPDAIISINQDQCIQLFNKGAERIFGYKVDEVLGKPLGILIPEISIKPHLQHVREFIAEEHCVRPMYGYREVQARRKDGTVFTAEASISKLSTENGMTLTAMLHDITERKTLENSWKRYSFIVNASQDFMNLIDRNYVYLTVNDAFLKALSMNREDVIGKTVADIWGEEIFKGKIKPLLDQCFSGHVENREFSFTPPLDGLRHYETSFYPYFNGKGKVELAAVVTRDITERKTTERKASMLLHAIENTGEAVFITDRNAVIEYVNPAFSKNTGYTPQDILGKTPTVLKSKTQNPAFYKKLWDTISRGEVWRGTLVDRKKDGSFYPVMMSVAPIHNDSGEITHYVAIQQDMTDYKKMEEQFLQAQKMEALGTLVGGIAHDFNNMLAAIQSNIFLAKRRLENKPEVNKRLDNIEQLGMRSADMVKQLLTFARKDSVQMNTLPLNTFIKEVFKLVRASIPENVDLVYDVCQEELIIDGDATQLQQSLMNLLNNARDAVAHMAHPTISCSLMPFVATADFKKAHPNIKGEHFAVLNVRDNGEGIKEAHLQKVFEPFFTTKGAGVGTGLGLAMVYGTAQSHGGTIEVESEQGQGTVFHMYLPLIDGVGNSLQEKDTAIIEGQGETILLVDDEDSIRSSTADVLNSLGYKVLSAADGEEALAMFGVYQHEISLVITDVVMPMIGGVDLAKAVRLLKKNMPILFITGYAKNQVMPIADQGEQIIITKPLPFAELSQTIRRMIDSN